MAHPRSATPDPLPRSRAAEAATGRVGQAAQLAPDPVGLAVRAGRVATAREAPVVPAAHGPAMTPAATSTTLRGGTDRRPGVLPSPRDRHGTGRFRRPV